MYMRRLKFEHWKVLRNLVSFSSPDVLFQLRTVPASNVWELVENLDVPRHAKRSFYEMYFPGFQSTALEKTVSVAVQRIWKSSDFNCCSSASLVFQLICKNERNQIDKSQILWINFVVKASSLSNRNRQKVSLALCLILDLSNPCLKRSKDKYILYSSWKRV